MALAQNKGLVDSLTAALTLARDAQNRAKATQDKIVGQIYDQGLLIEQKRGLYHKALRALGRKATLPVASQAKRAQLVTLIRNAVSDTPAKGAEAKVAQAYDELATTLSDKPEQQTKLVALKTAYEALLHEQAVLRQQQTALTEANQICAQAKQEFRAKHDALKIAQEALVQAQAALDALTSNN